MQELDSQMEQDIQKLNLNAPRITPEHIEALVLKCTYHVYVVPDTTTTVAVAFDKNGFSLCTAIMACASPENFNEELGRKYAVEKAERLATEKLWELEGYRLKCALANQTEWD